MDNDKYERQGDRLLNLRSRQVFELLKETIRLTVRVEEAELRAAAAGQGDHRGQIREGDKEKDAVRRGRPAPWQATSRPGDRTETSANEIAPAPNTQAELRAMLIEAHEQLLRRDGEIEALVHDLQADLAAALPQEAPDSVVEVGANNRRFLPGKYLRYRQLVRRIREVAQTTLPPGATVVVMSRGDEALLELGDGRRGWHFPREQGGVYAGHYPADSAEAIDHLEELRSRGGEFLLLPETSLWWLEYYRGFRKHLEERYRLFVRKEGTCLIFALGMTSVTEHGGSLVQASVTRKANHQDASV